MTEANDNISSEGASDGRCPPPTADPLPAKWVRLLEALSLVYIALPIGIFFLGWLRLVYAVPFAVALIVLLTRSGMSAARWAREHEAISGTAPRVDRSFTLHAIVILLATAFLVACTGAGGFTFQFSDYWVYDSHLLELMNYSWPIGGDFTVGGERVEMPGSMYWGYWLPGGLLAKVAGWNLAYVFQYFWNALGVLLALAWFLRIIGVVHIGYALLFLLFGGLDIIGYLATTPLPDGDMVTWWDYLTGTFWWSTGPGWMAHWSANYSLLTESGEALTGGVFFRFYGPLWFLSDGPHHVLPQWVLLFMVLHDALRRGTIERLFFLTSFLPLMSIFSPVGTVPILILAMVHTRGRGFVSVGNLVFGPLMVTMLGIYYMAVESDLPSGWLWEMQDVSRTWPYLLLYYVSAFLVYVAVAPSMKGNGYRPGRLWFYGAVAVFLLAPWYRMGVFSDFTTKIIIPSQLVFLLCLATAIRQPEGKGAQWRKWLTIGAIVIGTWSAWGIVHRAVTFGFSASIPPKERVTSSFALFRQTPDSQIYFHKDNFFWQHLAQPVEYSRPFENSVIRRFDFSDRNSVNPEYWIYFTEHRTVTRDGFVIQQAGDKPLLRRDDVELHASEIGKIEFRHSVVDEDGNVPEYTIVFNWASKADVESSEEVWPFHRWRSHVVHPPLDPWKPLSANPYWRGDIEDIALYFDVHGDPGKRYTITVEDLIFYQR